MSSLSQKHTVPLLFHIPCDSCEKIIEQLEQAYLKEVHRRCVQAKVDGATITGLFLELVIQCNVNDVLTGGRCKGLLE
eukprot:3016697-Ditylum_brightwellii.AAC.1